MCNYTQTLHTLCGCKTMDLLLPNLCRVAIRNSIACVYVTPHPDSMNSVPSLAFSASSISSMGLSPQTTLSPGMPFYSSSDSSESPQYQSFTATFEKQQEENEGFRRSMNFCLFHMEARLEELSGLQERSHVAKRTGEKARWQRRLREQEKQRLKEEREEEKRTAEDREEQERLARERAESERLAKERKDKKRKWMPSPKKFGMWTEQMVWDTVADGAGELRKWNGYLYLVTDDGPQFLGPL